MDPAEREAGCHSVALDEKIVDGDSRLADSPVDRSGKLLAVDVMTGKLPDQGVRSLLRALTKHPRSRHLAGLATLGQRRQSMSASGR